MFFINNYQVEVLRDSNCFPESPELEKAYNEYCDKKEKESLDYLRANHTIGNFKLVELFNTIIEKYLSGKITTSRCEKTGKKHFANTNNKFGIHFVNPNREDDIKFLVHVSKTSNDDAIEEILLVKFNLNNNSGFGKTVFPIITFNMKWRCYVDHVSFMEQVSVDHKKM